jgi:hypothetical protein
MVPRVPPGKASRSTVVVSHVHGLRIAGGVFVAGGARFLIARS